MDAHVAKALGERGQRVKREAYVSQHVPFTRHVDENTLETKDGHLVQVIKLEGFPFETADQVELNHLKDVRNTMLRGVASRHFALWHHIVRRRAEAFPAGEFPPGFAADMNERWRAHLADRRMYINDLYLTVVRRSPHGAIGAAAKIMAALSNKVDKRAADAARARALKELHDATRALLGNLAPYNGRLLALTEGAGGLLSEPVSFMHQLLTGERRPVLAPRMNLAQYLGNAQPFFGSEAIELRGVAASRYGAMLSIKEYRADTVPGMMDRFLEMPYEAIMTQSFTFIERQASLEAMKRQQRILDNAGDDAVSQVEEITQGLDDVASGRYSFGSHHFTIMPLCDSLGALDRAVTDANARLTDLGVLAVRESEGAGELAYWAQLPGNFGYIPRPAPISTLNFATFASFHNHPEGHVSGNHWGPAITLLETTSDTPFYFSFHVGDLGNATVIGPSGTGKTLAMSFLLAQAERIQPRLVFFDKDRGAEIFIRALGGVYTVLRPGVATGFNPFACSDSGRNRSFLVTLLSKMLTARGEILSAADGERIREAVDNLFSLPREARQLANMAPFFPHGDADSLAARLRPWYGDGDLAWLFDNETDSLTLDARVMGFDLTNILDDSIARAPALLYMFERVDQVLDGKPTIITVDEGWKAIADPVFTPRIEDWERTIRKRNGLLMFGSQSAQSIVNAPMGNVIIEQSPTQLFFPNLKADRASYIDGFGLTEREFQVIKNLAKESRCFLVKHGNNSAIAKLDMTGMDDVIAVLSGREGTVALLDAVRAEHGDDPAAWLPEFEKRRQQL